MCNYKTFKRIIIDDGDNFFSDNQIAIYIPRLNTLAIDSNLLNDSITVDMLVLIILHEYLHMASFDNKTKVIGYENEALPVTFNEACTQFLALKLVKDYGIKIENFMYVDSVDLLCKLILDIGEEVLFSDFFKADVKSMMVKLSSKRKLFIDYMLKFSNLLEEKYSLEGIDNFNNITNKMQ